MGLLSMFGVGGGSVTLTLTPDVANAGGRLRGEVVFAAGERAQGVTAIVVQVACRVRTIVTNYAENRTEAGWETQSLIAPTAVAPGFRSEPRRSYAFPFELVLPMRAAASAPGSIEYVVCASADIDNEIDPKAEKPLGVFALA